MGYATYSTSNRFSSDRHTAYVSLDSNNLDSVNAVFTQNVLRRIHESMDPKNALRREARDSETHPNTVPIVLALDVTGSMHRIPHELIKNGLPHMMDNIIQHGTPDPALLFLAIGDTTCDQYPLQVGQFESGDEELDTWLTRTYLEGGGGGNAGESYLLAWMFAARHTVTDAWEKRKQKGFLFTVGDEPGLETLPNNVMNHLMGYTPEKAFTATDLLAEVQKTYNVYHLHIMEGHQGHRSLYYWKNLLGQNCIQVDDHTKVASVISDIIVNNIPKSISTPEKAAENKEEEML